MDENKDSLQEDEYQVIQEKIVPKKKNPWKRFGKTLLRVTASGLVFGVIAGTTLVLSGKFLIQRLGLENAVRQVVGIGNDTQAPAPTRTPYPTKTPVPTNSPGTTDTPAPTSFVIDVPEITPGGQISIGGEKGDTPSDSETGEKPIQGFLEMYSEIAGLAGELRKSLVQISAIKEGVDWFEESYETTGNATGLYVGDNGRDMLFLANLDSIDGATKFKVTFANGDSFPCTIYSYDTNYRLAVLTVRLSAVSELEKENLPEQAEFALTDVEVGTPVMVLGNPNGHLGALALGMVTGTGQVVQVIDDEVLYFTTGITKYADGDGFIFNLAGEVIGIISNTLNKGEKGIITAAAFSGMREILEDTLNNVPRIYCGMRLELVDTVMGGRYSLPEGIYVTEVLPGSPAMYAGIKNGDIITTIGIVPVTGVRQFYKEICSVGAQSVRIVVSREAKGGRKEQTLFMVPETRLH